MSAKHFLFSTTFAKMFLDMKRLLNFRPIFYGFMIFLFGFVVTRKLFVAEIWAVLSVGTLLLCGGVFVIVKKKIRPIAFLFVMMILGGGFYFLTNSIAQTKTYEGKVAITGRVTDDITENKYSCYVVLDNVTIGGEKAGNISLNISKSGDDKIEAGKILSFESELENVKLFTLGQFNSSYYRKNVNYTASVKYENIVVTDGYTKFDENVRQAVKERLSSNLSEENAGICYAVLFGDKSAVDGQVKEYYTNSGLIHLLTVSGLHISFLIALFYSFLKLCRVNRYVNFSLTIIAIIFYSFLCGFTPSVLRAGIMGIVYVFAKTFGRRYDTLNSVGIAGFLIVLSRPFYAFDNGFLMSIACVVGIAFLHKVLSKFLAKIFPYKASSIISISLSAQIAIIPFLSIFSNSINPLSFVVNFFAIPLFSIIYPFLFVVSFLSTILPFMATLLVAVGWGITAITFMAQIFSASALSLSLSKAQIPATVFIYFICLFLSQFFMADAYKKFLFISLSLVLVTLVNVIGFSLSINKSSVVYLNSYNTECIVVTNKDNESLVISNNNILNSYFRNNNMSKFDYYVSLNEIKQENISTLKHYNFKNYYCTSGEKVLDGIEIVPKNTKINAGKFQIQYTYNDDKMMGISVSFDDYTIFVATKENLSYNTFYEEYISSHNPNLIILTGKNYNIARNRLSVAQGSNNVTTYNFCQNGNMRFDFNGDKCFMRGLD